MELAYALLADHAQVPPDGKVYVLGGGFHQLALPKLPSSWAFAAVAGFRFSAADVGKMHNVELRFLDGDRKLIVPTATLSFQSAGQDIPEGREVILPTVTYLQPMFGGPGEYSAEYWLGERMLARLPLFVMEQQLPVPVAPGRAN
jgi:hypothetical protein